MRRILPASLLFAFLAGSLAAQQPATPPAGSNWQHVQALPAGTFVHIKANTGHTICALAAVDADTLTCNRDTGVGTKQLTFQRTGIRTVKLAHRGRSAVLGAAIGGGAGVLAGGIQGSRSNYFAVKGAFAMIYGFTGIFAGAPTGYLTDFSGSTIYRAP